MNNNMEILEEVVSGQTIVKIKRNNCPGVRESNWESPVNSSPATSSGGYTSVDHEDEEMAGCLILLAQGGLQTADAEGKTKPSENKYGSRKFVAGGGPIGNYDYECKICGRVFHTFQALGGHRASHKKPKPVFDSDRKISPPGEEGKSISSKAAVAPSISTQLVNKGLNIENKMKIHECSICGSEFGSGQALGGHMRKHRATSNNSNTSKIGGRPGNGTMVDFDLNLPASPEEEEDRRGVDFNGRFMPDHRPGLFSVAALGLVGCHY